MWGRCLPSTIGKVLELCVDAGYVHQPDTYHSQFQVKERKKDQLKIPDNNNTTATRF